MAQQIQNQCAILTEVFTDAQNNASTVSGTSNFTKEQQRLQNLLNNMRSTLDEYKKSADNTRSHLKDLGLKKERKGF